MRSVKFGRGGVGVGGRGCRGGWCVSFKAFEDGEAVVLEQE